MICRRLLAGMGLLAVGSSLTFAGPIRDPLMGIDAGSFSQAITPGTNFSANNGGGVFAYYNPTTQFIISLTFQTTILTGLSQDTIASSFNCNDATNPTLPNPFFLNCSIGYVADNGRLTIDFFGVNPSDPVAYGDVLLVLRMGNIRKE